eukprot:g7702.t1
MKTTFSSFTLCLFLCAAGGYATTVSRSLLQNQPSSSSGPTRVVINSPVAQALANLKAILNQAIDQVNNGGVDLHTASQSFAVGLGQVIAKYLEDQVDPVNRRQAGVCLDGPDLDRVYTSIFTHILFKAFRQSTNKYAGRASKCIRKKVGVATRRKLRGVRYNTCTNPPGYLNGFMAEDDYKSAIASVFQPVLSAIKAEDEKAARNCETPGSL